MIRRFTVEVYANGVTIIPQGFCQEFNEKVFEADHIEEALTVMYRLCADWNVGDSVEVVKSGTKPPQSLRKPNSFRMKMQEMNRPPIHLNAYIKEEMDDYLQALESGATAMKDKSDDLAEKDTDDDESEPCPLRAEGFDNAIVGVGERRGQMPLFVYSVRKCIEILMAQGMTEDEARDYFEFNTAGGWLGEGTPMWLTEGGLMRSSALMEELGFYDGKVEIG